MPFLTNMLFLTQQGASANTMQAAPAPAPVPATVLFPDLPPRLSAGQFTDKSSHSFDQQAYEVYLFEYDLVLQDRVQAENPEWSLSRVKAYVAKKKQAGSFSHLKIYPKGGSLSQDQHGDRFPAPPAQWQSPPPPPPGIVAALGQYQPWASAPAVGGSHPLSPLAPAFVAAQQGSYQFPQGGRQPLAIDSQMTGAPATPLGPEPLPMPLWMGLEYSLPEQYRDRDFKGQDPDYET
ncbi:hypothetical protein MMC24_002552 [Lignoscripta atroalba]|nr:hypothetical protein [Lignoscripta atroalba]